MAPEPLADSLATRDITETTGNPERHKRQLPDCDGRTVVTPERVPVCRKDTLKYSGAMGTSFRQVTPWRFRKTIICPIFAAFV